jgi:hypothetical protein
MSPANLENNRAGGGGYLESFGNQSPSNTGFQIFREARFALDKASPSSSKGEF